MRTEKRCSAVSRSSLSIMIPALFDDGYQCPEDVSHAMWTPLTCHPPRAPFDPGHSPMPTSVVRGGRLAWVPDPVELAGGGGAAPNKRPRSLAALTLSPRGTDSTSNC